MNKLTRYLYRAPGSSLRLAGGLGLLSLLGTAAPMSAASPMLADISINVGLDLAPPPLRHEVIVGVSPGPDYVWVGGYWDGSPGHYTWIGGRWDHAPHGRGQWNAPHWDKDRDGHYHQTKGEWRDDDHRGDDDHRH